MLKSKIQSLKPAKSQSPNSQTAKMVPIPSILLHPSIRQRVHEARKNPHHWHDLIQNQNSKTKDGHRKRRVENHVDSVQSPRGINLRRVFKPADPILATARYEPDK